MKKNILNSVFATLISMIALVSCSDFLDGDNKSNISAEEYFNTEEGIAALRIQTYNELKSVVTPLELFEWGTDIYRGVHGGATSPSVFQDFSLTPENSDVATFYTNVYSLINYANCYLQYGEHDALAQAEGKFIRCYGYYLLIQQFGAVPYVTNYIDDAGRDYPRTPITELYPAIIEELESIMDDPNLPTNSIESYGHSGYISQRAVKALLARVCLAAGWDLETSLTSATTGTYNKNSIEYFNKAAQYAISAINSQTLTMTFEDKWSPYNQNNAEEIFSVQYDRDSYPGDVASGGHSLQNSYGGYLGNQSSTGMKYSLSTYALNQKSIYLWGEGDERWDGTFMNTMYNFIEGQWPTTGYYAYYTVSDKSNLHIAEKIFPFYAAEDQVEAEFEANKELWTRGDCTSNNNIQAYILGTTCTKYLFNGETGEYTKETNTYDYYASLTNFPNTVKKFDDPDTSLGESTDNDYRDIVLFHLSEMYLVAAEAYLMTGDEGTALTYLNAVRTRSNAVQLPSLDGTTYFDNYVSYSVPSSYLPFTSLDIILDEYAREMFGERTRWMDLRRTRQLVRYNVAFNNYVSSVNDMSNIEGEIKWYHPIPSSEIESNEGITYADQNPGY